MIENSNPDFVDVIAIPVDVVGFACTNEGHYVMTLCRIDGEEVAYVMSERNLQRILRGHDAYRELAAGQQRRN